MDFLFDMLKSKDKRLRMKDKLNIERIVENMITFVCLSLESYRGLLIYNKH